MTANNIKVVCTFLKVVINLLMYTVIINLYRNTGIQLFLQIYQDIICRSSIIREIKKNKTIPKVVTRDKKYSADGRYAAINHI